MRSTVVAGLMVALGACAPKTADPPDPDVKPRAWVERQDFDDFDRECAVRAADQLRVRQQLQPTETRILRLGKRFRNHYRPTRIVEFYTTTGQSPETYRFSCQMNGPGSYAVSGL
jgi:hypothetical protein